MRSIIKSSIILASVFTLAVATQAQEENSDTSASDNADTDAKVTEIGEPERCINSGRLARTKVINDKTVDFTLRNGKVYRNTLLTNCAIIRNNDRFTFRRDLSSQLCKGDQISSLETISDRLQSFGLCGLGTFQQIEVEESE